MRFLPISLKIDDKKILLVGGGKVALHKLKTLRKFTHKITILSKEFTEEILSVGLPLIKKEFEPKDLDGFQIIYACTNKKRINKKIYESAKVRNLLINVVDDPGLSEFVSPAIDFYDDIILAFSSDGKMVKKALVLREKVMHYLKGNHG